MARKLVVLVAVIGLLVGTASAQEVDARAALQASMKAMGDERVKTPDLGGRATTVEMTKAVATALTQSIHSGGAHAN